LFFKTEDGTILHGRMAGCGRELVIWAPGAGGSTIGAEKWCEPLEDKYGYTTFSYDLRGFGESKGLLFDFKNQIRDVQYAIDAAINRMKERDKGPDRVILIGHSLGSIASLTFGVQDPRIDVVFGISSLYSIDDFFVVDNKADKKEKELTLASIGKKILNSIKTTLIPPWWFKKFISFISGGKTLPMPKNYLTDELIKKVYLIHGKNDKYVPFAKSAKRIIEDYGLSEDKYLLVDGGHEFEKEVEEILEWIHSKL